MRTPAAVLLALLACVRTHASDEPLALEDAVRAALGAQPQLRAAEAEVQAAEARARQADWNRWGRVETLGLYTPAQKPLAVEFPGIPGVLPAQVFEVRQLDTYALSATLTQPLFTWGALSGERAAARRDVASSRETYARARQQLVLSASEAFLTAAAAEAAVAVAEQAHAQQAAFLRAAQSRMEAGSAARLDVLKAELSLKEAEAALLAARNRATLARESLVTVTTDTRFRGAPLREVADVAAELPSEAEAAARAVALRPDLEALRRQAEALDLRARALRASRLPALALRASLTQQNDDASRVFDDAGRIYQAGFAVSWDATVPLRNRAKLAELRAMREGLSQWLRAAEERVGLEVRSALANASEAQRQFDVARSALMTAEEQARVARLAYREGALSALEARDAELGLTAARFALLRARLDQALSAARLRHALGD